MRKQHFAVVCLLLAAFVLAGCYGGPETPVPPSDSSVIRSGCVRPESDNQYTWNSNSCVEVSTTVYRVRVKVDDEIVSHSETNADGSMMVIGGLGAGSYRMWQEGKGLLPVRLLSIDPEADRISVGSNLILKTSDLKAMGLPTGSTAEFICNMDTEVLSPVQHNQVLTTNRLTYELDDCRMTLPTFRPDR